MTDKEYYFPYNDKNIPLTVPHIEGILYSHGLPGYKVTDTSIFQKAMVHSTYVRRTEYKSLTGEVVLLAKCPPDCMDLQPETYEQLEFRGDSLLGAVVANYLCERFPNVNPGFLTNTRKLIVRNKTIGMLARDKLGLDKFFIISKHVEEMRPEHGRQNIEKLGDVFEAFIAALWIDSGFKFSVVNDFIVAVIETHLDIPLLLREDDNYKDKMQKYCQHTFQFAPTYKLMNEEDGRFTMAVCKPDGETICTGTASTKKQAEQNACKIALQQYGVL
jgi:ribonuclease-3